MNHFIFQSTLPRRERLHCIPLPICSIYFNPRSREGSDRSTQYLRLSLLINFNPRSREGSDLPEAFVEQLCKISIHAPAKGATFAESVTGSSIVFQSTLPRRERLFFIISAFDFYDFNPRSREGSDYFCPEIFSASANFNPRSREGSDNF